MADRDTDLTLSLVAIAYGAAVEPEKFDDLLTAWDRWLDQAFFSAASTFDPIASIFDDAVEVATKFDSESDAESSTSFDIAPAPALLFDAKGEVLVTNAVAKNFLEREQIGEEAFAEDCAQRIPAFADSPNAVYRIRGGVSQRSFIAFEAPLSDSIKTSHPTAARMVLLSQIDWNEHFEAELASLLNLSPAELRVARGLLEGMTAQELAVELDRSLPTIRTHIKTLLQKSGARRQSELIQLLTILRHASALEPPLKDLETVETGSAPSGYEQTMLVSPAGALPVVRYGTGKPMIYFTTSSRPEETSGVRQAFMEAGFQVLAPIRPGYGGTSRAGTDATEALLNGWLAALHASCAEPPVFVGHREGGIVAINAANRLLAAGLKVAGVALISTGAPVKKTAAWRQSPPSIRRSFIAANHAPAALALGYQTAARLFRKGPREQDKIVRYFYVDSPVDTRRLCESDYFETSRDNIAYCFQDPRQVVRDIALWSSEWAENLLTAADEIPVLFVHGDAHSFFPMEAVMQWSERVSSIEARAVPDAGQLALYQSPNSIARAIANIIT